MRVLIVEPERKPRAAEIDGSLEAMQNIVGGYIQAIYPFEDSTALVCNEEAKLLGLPLNRALRDEESGEIYDIVSGTFFLCDVPMDSESFTSLDDGQVEKLTAKFSVPETFLCVSGQIVVLPVCQ